MSKQSSRNDVIKAEADAETRYRQSIEAAKLNARAIADDTAHSESKRVAAEEAVAALIRLEEARVRAEAEADQATSRRTFWDWLRGGLR